MKTLAWGESVVSRYLAVALGPLIIGCGRSSGIDRLPVHGTVAHPSEEKINGSVSFVPERGRAGPAAVTSLVHGEYRFDKTNGPTAGSHRVIVVRTAIKEQPLEKPDSPNGRPVGKQGATARPPPSQWTLSADVPANGPYRIDLKLP